jgi:hypothetical protein
MPISATAAEIIKQNRPRCATQRLRPIWPDIEALRGAGYSWIEISDLLRRYYGIEVSYKTFMTVRRRRRLSEQVALEAAVGPSKRDPFEKSRQIQEESDRVNKILAGRKN